MSLSFTVVDARAEPYAATPTIALRMRAIERAGREVHAVALRCQIRIEPQRRAYAAAEQERLVELFGATPAWAESLRPFPWLHASTVLPGFRATTDFDLPVPCTYDFDVAAAKYLHALDDGDVPLVLLFSGTVFTAGAEGFRVEPVAWHEQAAFRMPVAVWREVMDRYFPGEGWIRVSRETIDALMRFKAAHALPTWDLALERLLQRAGP